MTIIELRKKIPEGLFNSIMKYADKDLITLSDTVFDVINFTFVWKNTNEGNGYWQKKSDYYEKFYKQYNKKH